MNRSALSLSYVASVAFVAWVTCSAMGFGTSEPSSQSPTPASSGTRTAVGHPSFASPHAKPIAICGQEVWVVNTAADTVDIIDLRTQTIDARISVGIDPVSLAVRPDGKEIWVSNHVSDSVSVIDNVPSSATYRHVVATIQEFDSETRATRFDEPVAIAFANNDKAYIALSSENEIAVVDVHSHQIKRRLPINAQDPRDIAVRGDRLYVIPFESNNKTQLSGGVGELDGDLVTFNAFEHSIANNNVLSLGHVVDIVKHPRVPDRDLFVFDTETDELVDVVETLGTLLYGLTIDSTGRVFIAQTDARNDINGRAGTKKHGLSELENRAFLNRISAVTPSKASTSNKEFFDLEPLPPMHPASGEALATPFAIQVSQDDSLLVATAAGSHKLFTVDAASGSVLGTVDVGAVPRGIALEHADDGTVVQAWTFNAVENSVSLVDLADPSTPSVLKTITLEDPTNPAYKRGRIAFNDAKASSTGTYSCASCHPDGHTDQLLWVLKTPVVSGGNQIMPRSTMPIRGLRDTEPYHWDGIPGDPYGGNNSANIHGSDPPNSDLNDPTSSTRHLIDGGLAATMKRVDDPALNDEGKEGYLTAAERDDMALFLLGVPYPPAQRRAYDNVVSDRGSRGFELFHIDGDDDPTKSVPNVCGDCHRMPFWVSTNTPGTGMDAPTWRGAYDRWLILPQGRLNIVDFDFFHRVAEQGIPEQKLWRFSWGGRQRFDPVWDMVLEASTGQSGSFARQVTLTQSTVRMDWVHDLLGALEQSAAEGAVVLQCDGVLTQTDDARSIRLQLDTSAKEPAYVSIQGDAGPSYSSEQLKELAKSGGFTGTFTARHGSKTDFDQPQPAIWTRGPIQSQRGHQQFPILHRDQLEMTVSGRHLNEHAHIIIDGRRVAGHLELHAENDDVVIQLERLPEPGTHLLQLQNPNGLFSNDFIIHTTEDAVAAKELRRENIDKTLNWNDAFTQAIRDGDLDDAKRLSGLGAKINGRRQNAESTPLTTAALHGQTKIAKWLIRRGANVNGKNRDGNAPLHIAAFLCNREMVELLLKHGARRDLKNGRGESSLDIVSSPWNQQTADFYRMVAGAVGIEIEVEQVRQLRPEMAARLAGKRVEGQEADIPGEP